MSALSSIPRRVKIKLKKSISSADATVAQFGECIIQFFGFTEKGYGNVGWRHENDELTLFGLEKGSTCLPHKVVVIKHASLCPMLHLDKSEFENLPAEVKDRGVNIGVAILLTSTDNHVLITRRSGHMRTFPGVWVPPGGHIESGETLFEAGARELREETGLVLESVPHHLLGLWESVYPHKLEMGGPSRQHVVVYLSVKSHLPWRKLADRVKVRFEIKQRPRLNRARTLSIDFSWNLQKRTQPCGYRSPSWRRYRRDAPVTSCHTWCT